MSVLGSVAGSVGSAVGGAVLGGSIGQKAASSGSKRGFKYYRKQDQYDWDRAVERGLTPQEFYGSPAGS